MRFNNLLGGTFLGVLFILVGIAALLRSFNIDIPFGRIIIGLLIIYVGVAILVGGGIFIPEDNVIIFSNSNIKVVNNIENEYTILFGSGTIDLTDINLENVSNQIEINTIFGASEILLASDKPIRIEASSVFGKATVPNGNYVSFGDLDYTNITTEEDNYINMKVASVFGGTNIRFVK